MTVRELLDRIDSREIAEWMAYERIAGPLGGERLDVAAGIVASTVANANRDKKSKVAKITDFMPTWDRRQQSDEEMWAAIRESHKAMGGTTQRE